MLRFDLFRAVDHLLSGAFDPGSMSVPLDAVVSADAVHPRGPPRRRPRSDRSLGGGQPVDPQGHPSHRPRQGRTNDRPRTTFCDFTRTLMLSEGLDGGRINARYEHRVLTVAIPQTEIAQFRRIQIGVAGRGLDRPTDPNSPARPEAAAEPVGAVRAGRNQPAASEPGRTLRDGPATAAIR